MKEKIGRGYQMEKAKIWMRVKEVSCVIFAAAVVCALCVCAYFPVDVKRPLRDDISLYVKEEYGRPLREPEFFASGICVSGGDVSLEGFEPDISLTACALFDVNEAKVLQGFNLYGSIFPASTTKLLTAYAALKYGNLDDTVTVGVRATDLDWDAQVCGLKEDDRLSLYDLLCGLLLYSGNDCGIAIAEHISGSEEEFMSLINEEALRIGATGTHFVNPHGLHSDEHYTTAYDLYLIFRECVKFPEFNEIISLHDYTAHITDKEGESRAVTWGATNRYSSGGASLPENFTGLGGKTGFTDEAGCCLVYSSKDEGGDIYISVVMGADDREILYEQTGSLLSAGRPSKGGL